MLERIHIENFKSLKDVTLELQQVNLLIGPNNSGKSNLLKALEFFGENLKVKKNIKSTEISFKKNNDVLKLQMYKDGKVYEQIIKYNSVYYKFPKFDYVFNETYAPDTNMSDYLKLDEEFVKFNLETSDIKDLYDYTLTNFKESIQKLGFLIIYSPQPDKFRQPSILEVVKILNSNCSNLVSYIFNLSQNHRKLFSQLEENLKNCIGDITSLSTPIIKTKEGNKLGLKFFDKDDNPYWAEEVSEGVLYFLALLCIIHQPNPPKLLLLEEPERGIHPRRIKEVIDFIFTLAQEKGIQVIMTSHHERVLDYFEDIPEAVFVFDKDEEGATQVKNLKKDIIDPSNEENDRLGLPRIKFTESLGEHWVTGFIGGVPKPITY
jgi:predicted ATPase